MGADSGLSRWWPAVAVVVALQLAAVATLIAGRDTLYLRDVLSSHLLVKSGVAAELRQGRLPVVEAARGGQPLTGNPNALPFYPDNLLFLVGSDLWALNAHFWVHFLIAPWAFYWLGRRLGLSPAAAWGGGAVWALSGFFLSQMSHYNLVAGAALVPAFLASCQGAASGRRRLAVAAGFSWALLLLAGDPQTAALALLAAAGLLAWALGSPSLRPTPRGTARLLVAGLLGTLVASPQIVELLRILPASYRGVQGFPLEQRLLGSWQPLQALEWLLPFFFGPIDRLGGFWGHRHFDEGVPYFATLHLGVVALALALAAGWRGRLQRLAWLAVAAGLFVALGRGNPLLVPLMELPGAALVRFPVRAFLWVTLGLSLLAGVALQGAFLEREAQRGQAVRGALWSGALVLSGLALLLALGRDPGLAGLVPEALGDAFLEAERRRWAGLAATGGAACLLALVALRASRRAPLLGLTLLLGVHAAGQLALLSPALARDLAARYGTPPELLAHLEPGTRLAQSARGDLFGPSSLGVGRYPDQRAHWLPRRAAAELYPFAGVPRGLRYELALTPEGLDSYLAWLARGAVQSLDDTLRLRLLRAWGVEGVLVPRPLDTEAALLARLLARREHFGGEIRLYAVEDPVPEVRRVEGVSWALDPRAAVGRLLDPSFDPGREVVLAGTGEGAEPGRGALVVLGSHPEWLEVETSGERPGVLVVERAHLPVYRAAVAEREVPVRVANLFRIGVEVPPGRHRVRLWVDRRPLRRALALSALGLVLLPAVGWRRAEGRPGPTRSASSLGGRSGEDSSGGP